MGSSPKTQTTAYRPPSDALASRAALSNFLVNLLGPGGMGGNNPFDQYVPSQESRGVLEETLRTGLPADATPLVAQARGTFENEMAPAIKESLGAKYGIRFGTPVAESLSRAGRDVNLGLNAELARLGENAQMRRYGAAQFGVGQSTSGLAQLLQTMVSGTGALSGTPGQQQTSTSQGGIDWGQLLATVGTLSMAAFGACWIAEAIYGPRAPETWKVRIYLNGPFARRWYGAPVMWAYRRYGRAIARSKWAVRALKPLFAVALRKANAGTV